jgi:hypothetical protein
VAYDRVRFTSTLKSHVTQLDLLTVLSNKVSYVADNVDLFIDSVREYFQLSARPPQECGGIHHMLYNRSRHPPHFNLVRQRATFAVENGLQIEQ